MNCGNAAALFLTTLLVACHPPQQQQTGASPPAADQAEAEWMKPEFGAELYTMHCRNCHSDNGRGVPYTYPSLHASDTDVVSGDPDYLIKMMLVGIGVGGKSFPESGDYSDIMAPFDYLSDEEIAAVLTYIRSQWENDARAVPPQRVAAVRKAVLE